MAKPDRIFVSVGTSRWLEHLFSQMFHLFLDCLHIFLIHSSQNLGRSLKIFSTYLLSSTLLWGGVGALSHGKIFCLSLLSLPFFKY